jgi:hypothetical protein
MDFVLWRMDSFLDKHLETDNETTTVTMQRCSKHATTTIVLLLGTVLSVWSVLRSYLEDNWGGVEYLHRDSASGRRRRKGNSQI